MTVRINKQKINLREKLTEFEDKVNFDEVVRGLGENTAPLILNKDGGNVGIGVTNPYAKTVISLAPTIASTIVNETADFADQFVIANSGASNNGDRLPLIFNVGGDWGDHISAGIVAQREESSWNTALSFWTNNVTLGSEGIDAIQEKMRIDSSGNVGIGTTNPSNLLHVQRNTTSNAYAVIENTTVGNAGINLKNASGDWNIIANAELRFVDNAVGAGDRMRIDSSGNLLIGKTAFGLSNTGVQFSPVNSSAFTADNSIPLYINRKTSDGDILQFRKDNTTVGSISVTGSATSYNTSSDYRLKTDVQAMTGAIERLKALKPVNFEWISDGTRVDGFLAHEAQEIVPEAVTGTKDAMQTEEYEATPAVYEDVIIPAVDEVVDEDGNIITEAQEERTEQKLVSEAVMGEREVPDYQGIDQSKLVPLLTAAIQEQQSIIEDLKSRIETLESK